MTDTATPPRPSTKSSGPRQSTKSISVRAQSAANDAGERFVDEVESNPLTAVAAGVAVGLVAGVLLPKTKVEGRYLGAVGAALNESAVTAAKAAGEAGKAELAALGVSKVGANEQLGKLLQGLGGAVRSASEAARETRRKRPAGEATPSSQSEG